MTGGILLLLQGPPHNQAQFRTEVRLVHVEVSVFDPSGGAVRGLRKDDFRVLEDGRQVSLEFFWRSERRDAQASRTERNHSPSARVTFSNDLRPGGRALAIVLDANQIAFRPRLAARARRVAGLIIDGLESNDFAAIVTIGGRESQQSDFTRSKRALRQVLERFVPTGSPIGNSAAERFEKATHSLNAARALARLVEALKAVDGRRRGIVLVSGGGPFNVAEPSGLSRNPHEEMVRSAFTEVVALANRETVPLYTFDAHEMVSPMSAGQRTLQWLAKETGGLAIVNTNTLEPGVRSVLDATAVHYVLGYYSDLEPGQDLRTVVVETSRQGLRVKARRAFVAHTRAQTLTEAIRLALPMPDVPIRVSAAPLQKEQAAGTGLEVVVDVEPGKVAEGTVYDALLVVTNMRGSVEVEQRLNIGAACHRPHAVQNSNVRACSTVRLKPGRYMLRIAVRRAGDRAIGTAFEEVQIPK